MLDQLYGKDMNDPKTWATLNMAAGLIGGRNFGDSLSKGLGAYQGTMQAAEQAAALKEDRALKKLMADMQLEELTRAAQKRKGEEAWRAKTASLLNPEPMSGMEAIGQSGRVGPTVDKAGAIGTVPQVDQSALYRHLLDPYSPFADDLMKQKLFPEKPKLMTVKPGDVVLNENDPTKPVFTAPEKIDSDPKITQYMFAVRNGYKGTFEQFITLGPAITAAAMAPLRAAQINSIEANDAYRLPQPAQTPRQVMVTVNGQTFAFPDQQSADNFKRQAGVK